LEREERIDEVLLEWRERLDRGEPVDQEEILRRHPDLAGELRARFQALAVFDAVCATPSPTRDLRTLPADRYEDFELLGRGGMGIVYGTRDRDLHRRIAYKTIPSESEGDGQEADPTGLAPPPPGTRESRAFENLRARFLQEAWVTAGLEHPGIVPVYELGENEEGIPYYTMRFVMGKRTLSRAIDEAGSLKARIELLEPFLKVCDTVQYAHSRGVIHRDLKPDHIVLGEFGEVIVLDWGLAKVRGRPDFGRDQLRERIEEYREAAELKTSASALGTPGYMSPEAARGRTDLVDERSDIFSLGAILYRILTRRLPFEAPRHGEEGEIAFDEEPPWAATVEPGVPEELARIAAKALAIDHEERYAGVSELSGAIRDWRRDSTIETEITALLREASAALAAEGDPSLGRLDRVHALCSRVLHLRPDDPRALDLSRRAEDARHRALLSRERRVRTRLILRIALPVFLIAVLAGLTAWLLELRRREAVRAEVRVTSALRSARALALAQTSEMVEPEDPMLSLLLAREAARSAPLFPVISRLHRALARSRERAILVGHGDRVNTAVFSPSGDRILTASDDETARVWSLAGGLVTTLSAHEDRVRSAAFSPSGDRIVTTSDDMTARIWDREGRPLTVLRGHEDYVVSAEFSASGDRILTVSWDRTARLWSSDGEPLAVFREEEGVPAAAFVGPEGDVVTASRSGQAHLFRRDGTLRATLSGHRDTLTAVAVSPDRNRILTGSRDGTARLWDREGRPLAVLRGHAAGVNVVRFSPSGEKILTGAEDGQARVWSKEGRPLATLDAHSRRINAIAMTKREDRIATASDDGTITLWSGDYEELAVLRDHTAEVFGVSFSPSGEWLLSASGDATARVFAVEEFEVAVLAGHRDEIESAVFSPDGTLVLTASDDGTARVWDAEGDELSVLRGHDGFLTSADFSPDGRRIVTASWDGTARLFDTEGRLLSLLEGHTAGLWSARFSPDGRYVVTASEDRTARLFDRDGKPLAVLTHPGSVFAAAFSPDSRLVLTAAGDRKARLFDLEGRIVAELTGHEGRISSVAFSPDGMRVLTGSWDRTARTFALTGKPLAVLAGHGSVVEAARFSPDGTHILTAAGDGVARIFGPDGRLVAQLAGHARGIAIARYSPDGRYVLTATGRIFGSTDSTARLWTARGREVAVLDGHAGRVGAAAFSPSGDRILTASADGTARIWLVEPEDLLRLADARITRSFTAEERRRYLTVMDPESQEHDGD
jgi:WD40 repeat protein/serine/threonine protein kinase